MKNILVAEDDTFLANAYKVKLSKAGFNVVVVTDGEEAMNALKNNRPDLLILDLMMPKKDGFSVLADMKKDPNLTNIPCIVASNMGQKEDLDRVHALGIIDYVVKTDLSLSNLVFKIKKMLGE